VALLLVSACGGGASAPELVVQTVSEDGGAPIAGVAVQLDDGAWVTTGADGTARFRSTAASHTVRIHQTSTGTAHGKAFEFHDVWSLIDQPANPLVIPVDGSTAPTQHHATISGVVTGASGTVLVFAHSDAYQSSAQTTMATDGTFTLSDVTWEGDATHGVTVEAIDLAAGDPPAHYNGYGNIVVTATDGGQVNGVAVALAPIGEFHLSGTLTLAPELTGSPHAFLSLAFGDGSSIPLATGTALQPGAFDVVFPTIASAEPRITIAATDAAGGTGTAERTVCVPAGDVVFSLPRTALPAGPGDNTTFDATTLFDWSTAEGGGKYGMTLGCDWTTPDGTVHDANFRLIEAAGAQTSVPSIPDLVIPSGTSCTWSVAWFDGDADGFETTAHADTLRYSFSAAHPIRVQ